MSVYFLLMYHKSADMVTLESELADNQAAVLYFFSAVCIWKFSPGSCPVPAEGHLPTAVIVCNYLANLFNSAGSGW